MTDKICFTKEELIKEHSKLVHTLKQQPNKTTELKEEAADQSKELGRYKRGQKSIEDLPLLKSDGGMSGLSTAQGSGGAVTTVGMGSYPRRRKKRK